MTDIQANAALLTETIDALKECDVDYRTDALLAYRPEIVSTMRALLSALSASQARAEAAEARVGELGKLCKEAADLYGQGGTFPIDGVMSERLRTAARTHAEALLNPDQWRPIEEAPQGEVTEDVGCRGASEWFEGRVAPKYQHGRPPYIIVRRRAWPQEDGWECPGEATYVPGLIDAWRPLRPTHFRELKGPGQ